MIHFLNILLNKSIAWVFGVIFGHLASHTQVWEETRIAYHKWCRIGPTR